MRSGSLARAAFGVARAKEGIAAGTTRALYKTNDDSREKKVVGAQWEHSSRGSACSSWRLPKMS